MEWVAEARSGTAAGNSVDVCGWDDVMVCSSDACGCSPRTSVTGCCSVGCCACMALFSAPDV